MRLTLEVAPHQVSGCLVQCSCPLAMELQGPHGSECSEAGPGKAGQGQLPGQTFSRLPFQPPHSLGDCLHLTAVVCLGCGLFATGTYCLLA